MAFEWRYQYDNHDNDILSSQVASLIQQAGGTGGIAPQGASNARYHAYRGLLGTLNKLSEKGYTQFEIGAFLSDMTAGKRLSVSQFDSELKRVLDTPSEFSKIDTRIKGVESRDDIAERTKERERDKILGEQESILETNLGVYRKVQAQHDEMYGDEFKTFGVEDEGYSKALEGLDERFGSVDLRRGEALAGLGGAQRTAQRGLLSNLGAAGVKGGVAASALVDQSQANIRAMQGADTKARMEKDALSKDLFGTRRQHYLDRLGRRDARRNLDRQVSSGLLESARLKRDEENDPTKA